MREIKFRVWLEGNHMITVDSSSDFTLEFGNEKPFLSMFSSGGEFVDKGEVEHVMQFTGLKDKHGKEIYEGDIVKISGSGEHEIISEVKFGANGACVLDKVWLRITGLVVGGKCSIQSEILGNIHETPELLTNKG